MKDTALLLLVAGGIVLGVVLFVRWLPRLSPESQLARKRREIERLVSERRRALDTYQAAPKKSPVTFGCLMKWLAVLGLASWTAGLAAWAVYVIVALVSLVLALVISGMAICLYLVFLRALLGA